MFKLSNIALASVAGIALSLGIVGCEAQRPDVIPSSAQMWAQGNQMMHYQAPQDGTVYVFDHNAQRLIWSGKVFKGQSVDVDTQKGQIMAGGILVVNKIAAPADQKDIYFDPSPMPTQPMVQTPQPTSGNGNGVLVTPNVTVQPSDGASTHNGVTVQPGVTVTPGQ